MAVTHWTLTNRHHEPFDADLHHPEGQPRGVVVLVHGFKSFKDWGFYPAIAEALAEKGLAAIRFDFSRNGIGPDKATFEKLDQFEKNTFGLELDDLDRVVTKALETFNQPPILWGHSRGGALSILYAGANPTKTQGIITWAAVSTFDRWNEPLRKMFAEKGYIEVSNQRTGQIMRVGRDLIEEFDANPDRFDILAHAGKLTVPHLLIHGDQDQTAPCEEGQAIAAVSPQCEFVRLHDGDHTLGGRHPWEEPVSHVFERALQISLAKVETVIETVVAGAADV